MKRILILAIKGYRLLLSPVMASHCRFYPTCSHYGIEALQQHGALKGSYLTLRRLLRCHPLHPGGYDPVPTCQCTSSNLQLSRSPNND